MVTFSTATRIDMDELKDAFDDGKNIKVFNHPGGWSVECVAGVLSDSGTDVFSDLKPLVESLKDHGIDKLDLRP